MIDLAVFDVNETLFPLDPLAERMTQVGLDGQLERWFARVLRDGMAAAAAGRFVAFAELAHHHLLALLDDHPDEQRGDPDDAVAHVLAGFEEVEAHPDVAAGLTRLVEGGVKVVTLTNGAAQITRGFLRRSGLEQHVDELHDVTETGYWKPHAAPYRGVVAQHGLAPERAALIAVHPWDVFGAQSAGLLGAWLDRAGTRYPAPFGVPDVTAHDLPTLADRLLASN